MELVVNVTRDWAIGKENRLLVHLSGDMKFFRSVTTGKTVVLGRKTLATFPGGRPLKNRRNLILSTNPDLQIEGAEVVHSVEELCSAVSEEEQVAVIGGSSVYDLLLPYCEKAIVTKTEVSLPADCYFHNLDEDPDWELVSSSEPQEEDGITFRFLEYRNHNVKKL